MPAPSLIQTPLLDALRGYVNGAFLPPAATLVDVEDPASGATIAQVSSHGEQETLAAVRAAESVLEEPASLSERRTWLERIAEAHVVHRETLAQIITLENGKPLAEAR